MKAKKVADMSFRDPEKHKKDETKDEDQTHGRKSGRTPKQKARYEPDPTPILNKRSKDKDYQKRSKCKVIKCLDCTYEYTVDNYVIHRSKAMLDECVATYDKRYKCQLCPDAPNPPPYASRGSWRVHKNAKHRKEDISEVKAEDNEDNEDIDLDTDNDKENEASIEIEDGRLVVVLGDGRKIAPKLNIPEVDMCVKDNMMFCFFGDHQLKVSNEGEVLIRKNIIGSGVKTGLVNIGGINVNAANIVSNGENIEGSTGGGPCFGRANVADRSPMTMQAPMRMLQNPTSPQTTLAESNQGSTIVTILPPSLALQAQFKASKEQILCQAWPDNVVPSNTLQPPVELKVSSAMTIQSPSMPMNFVSGEAIVRNTPTVLIHQGVSTNDRLEDQIGDQHIVDIKDDDDNAPSENAGGDPLLLETEETSKLTESEDMEMQEIKEEDIEIKHDPLFI